MAKKSQVMNIPNTEKGIFRLKEASRHPANRKLFNAIINGELDESVVNPSYMDVEIEFINDELDSVCRCMTRDKIKAYQNDINKSAEDLANQFLSALNDDNHAAEVTNQVINDVGESFNEEEDTDMVARIVTMAIIKSALKSVLNTRTAVKAAANESTVVDLVKDSSETPAEETHVVEVVENPETRTINWTDLENDPTVIKIMSDERLAELKNNEFVKPIVQMLVYMNGTEVSADDVMDTLTDPAVQKYLINIGNIANEFISPSVQQKFIHKLINSIFNMCVEDETGETKDTEAKAEPVKKTASKVTNFPRISDKSSAKDTDVSEEEDDEEEEDDNPFAFIGVMGKRTRRKKTEKTDDKSGKYALTKDEIVQDKDEPKEETPKVESASECILRTAGSIRDMFSALISGSGESDNESNT